MTEYLKKQMMMTMMKLLNEHGTKDGNAHGHNGDVNDRGEGGGIGAAVGGNNDAASVGSAEVDPVMFPRNYEPKKLQTREYKLKTFHLRQI
jgi:hypothetical protein